MNTYNKQYNKLEQDVKQRRLDSITYIYFLIRRNQTFGGDLRATDIQRGRDHALGNYLDTRQACGLPVPRNYHEMTDFIPQEVS